MKKYWFFAALFILINGSMQAQQMFQNYSGVDVGNPKLTGNFQFDKKNQQFILEGAGYNTWFERDEFYFVSQEAEGDFILSANLKFLGEGADPHRKIGLMIRNSKNEDAVYMDGAIHGDGLASLQYRTTKGGETREIASAIEAPQFVQVERAGNEFIFRVSNNGRPLVEVGRVTLEMASSVFAGMFICSHNEDVIEKAMFWNVRIEKPAQKDVDGYQSPSPSRLEILNIETGNRNVVFETNQHIEAPNWSRNGNFLVYNSDGKLYHFDLKKRVPKEIDTDFASSNNNDHGISFDGKTMAISHHTEENGRRQSIIYTVPLEGGIPRRITPNGPSYWHGWSPDDKWLVYCAERNGNYDVYKISAGGGEEIRLTTADGLDDGPEYSPDGKYIYFNSVRSGKMEIWRMNPDGTGQEQVTNDAFQNWFAHPSPDGKWLIMISYLPEVPAGSHPHNQRVMLRLMPARGGDIKTVAFLYGGQGTINVPSWSPDSKKVAFVSYTY
ncbi:WD40-like Beta Propeller Repeat [Mariniphaga anaerophila]|uniref:WD40-like Beta Propeller Repeat n=1 Tax=Mariniphaga anaerophila TaxID=1484053 RepID=A0A1M4VWG7_9BACT|nr:TolB family protein [Mariniphaga anaerophila]SHE73250.1 WD40-like Beta Propeller Repeat [Mariniphaga anaerophila]